MTEERLTNLALLSIEREFGYSACYGYENSQHPQLLQEAIPMQQRGIEPPCDFGDKYRKDEDMERIKFVETGYLPVDSKKA